MKNSYMIDRTLGARGLVETAMVSLVAACAGPAPPAVAPAAVGPPVVAFEDVTVLPMTSDTVLPGRTVVVVGDRIAQVGEAGRVLVPSGASRIDGRGRFLMPGLADMHVHIWHKRDLPLYLGHGVTAVRNMNGSPLQLEWRDAIEAGRMLGPLLVTSGPIIGENREAPARTPEEGRAIVREQAAAGYDFIKVYNQVAPDVYAAIFGEASLLGLPVAGHVPLPVGLEQVMASGQHSIEHLTGYIDVTRRDDAELTPGWSGYHWVFADTGKQREWARSTAARGVWNVPTLGLTKYQTTPAFADFLQLPAMRYISPSQRTWMLDRTRGLGPVWLEDRLDLRARQLPGKQRMLLELVRAGAPVALGTDAGLHGWEVHRQLELMVDAGLTEYEALRSATADAGDLVGRPFGTVEPGQRADLLLLDGNPLDHVGNVRHQVGVMAAGRWYDRDRLLEVLESLRSTVWVSPAARPEDRVELAKGEHPQLQPDGQSVYYQAVEPTEEELIPVWSAEGRPLHYVRVVSLMTVPVHGGLATRVARVVVPVHSDLEQPPSYHLSSDGREIAFQRLVSREPLATALAIVPPGGGPTTDLVRFDGAPPIAPRWAPDAGRIAFAEGRSLYVLDRSHGAPRTVAEADHWKETVRWSPDGRYLVGVAIRGESHEVVLHDIQADTTRVLAARSGQIHGVTWHPDGRQLALMCMCGRWQIERIPLEGGPAPAPWFDDAVWAEWIGTWSADGTEYWYRAYSQGGDSENRLFRLDLGSNEVRMIAGEGFALPSWDLEGKLITWSGAGIPEEVVRLEPAQSQR